MEKRSDVTLKQSYVNRVTEMLNSCTIPPGNRDIMLCLILGKTGNQKKGIVFNASLS